MFNTPTIERARYLLRDAVSLAEHGGVYTGAALLDILGDSIDRQPALWGGALMEDLRTVSSQFRHQYAPILGELPED